jgi:hypothetical protein
MSTFETHFETENTAELAHRLMMSSVEQAVFVKTTFENELIGFTKRVAFAASVNAAYELFSDQFAEAYHAAMNHTICSGSGGSGWDQKDKGESKLASFANNKKCSVCGETCSYFVVSCHECGSQNFTMATDARWGIKAKSHVKYLPEGLKEYRLMTIKPLTSDLSDKSFLIEDFVIDANSPGLNALIESQLSSPKSSDSLNFHTPKNNLKTKTGRHVTSNINFFLCEPKQTLRAILTFPDDCANMDVEYVDYVNPRTVKSTEYTSTFKSEDIERAMSKGVSLHETDISELSDDVKVSLVEQGSLGKERGKTSR